VPGTTYPIYTDNRGPDNGAVRLAAQSSPGFPCSASGGDSLYRAEITGGIVTTCPVQLNDVLTTKNTAVTQGGKEVDAVYVGDAPTDASAAGPLQGAYHAELTG